MRKSLFKFMQVILVKQPLKKLNSSRTGFVLAAVLGLVIIMGILFTAIFIQMLAQLKESDMRVSAHESFYLAESGIERAVYELRQNSSWQQPPPGFGQAVTMDAFIDEIAGIGSYEVQVAAAPNWFGWGSVFVRADGMSNREPTAPKAILVRVIVASPTKFFTSTLGDLRIGAGSNVSGDLLGRDLTFLPGVTGNPGDAITVDGHVMYMRNISGASASGVTITGGVPVQIPAFTFSGVDLIRYQGLAQNGGTYFPSDQTISGTFSKASFSSSTGVPNLNGVVYVNGNLTINGEYDDNLLIVASGNIIINGHILNHANSNNPGAQGNKQLGLFAKGNIKITANAPNVLNLEAFLTADAGTFRAEGIPGSHGIGSQLNFTGAISVRGSTNLSDPTMTGVELNAYSDRDFVYNSHLNTNSTIPFLPSIADIIEWSEINPNDMLPIPNI